MNASRRCAHYQTPIVLLLTWLICTLGLGAMTVARDGKRAAKIGAILDASEKWAAFWHGCASGTMSFFILLLLLATIIAIGLRSEDWRWKRQQNRRKFKP